MIGASHPPRVANGNASSLPKKTSVLLAQETSELASLFDAKVNVLCLRRTPNPELLRELRDTPLDESSQFLLRGANMLSTAHGVLPTLGCIAEDLAYWSEVLVDLVGCEAVGVRLAQTTKAMCPRFHVDRVTVRLVITYRGPATEFVAGEHVRREALGSSDAECPDTLLRGGGGVQRAQEFDVVALKGERWPGNVMRGAVHRSPEVLPGTSRVVATLDPL